MTAIVADRLPQPGFSLRRVVVVARAVYVNWPVALAFPLGIMFSSFLINVLIFAGISDAIEDPTTGGLASIYVVQVIVCWQGLVQNFSFAVGLNATRRSFYAAAVLVAFTQSLLYAGILYVLGIVERATGGWGVDLRFFDPLPLTHSASPVTILVYAVPLLMLSAMGLFFGSVTKRWGSNGIFSLSILAILVGGGLAALITYTHGWPTVGDWLISQSWQSIVIGWLLIPTVLATAGGWWVLRRAVP